MFVGRYLDCPRSHGRVGELLWRRLLGRRGHTSRRGVLLTLLPTRLSGPRLRRCLAPRLTALVLGAGRGPARGLTARRAPALRRLTARAVRVARGAWLAPRKAIPDEVGDGAALETALLLAPLDDQAR